MKEQRFKDFIAQQIKSSPIEARLVRKVIRGMKAADKPIVNVYDGEEHNKVRTEVEVMEQVFNLDECWLVTMEGSWVRVTLGNEWECLTDYTTDLDDVMDPIADFVDKHAA